MLVLPRDLFLHILGLLPTVDCVSVSEVCTELWDMTTKEHRSFHHRFDGLVASVPRALWAIAHNCPTQHMMREAVVLDDLAMVKWLYEKGVTNLYILTYAAEQGRLEIFKWGMSLFPKLLSPVDVNFAAKKGHLHILKWVFWIRHTSGKHVFDANHILWNTLCKAAAKGGHVSLLDWLTKKGCKLCNSCVHNAALRGHFEAVKWLSDNGAPLDNASVFWAAAQYGDVKLLEFLYARGCPWNAVACMEAAKAGKLKALMWLRERRCPWDQRRLCTNAAAKGHLEVVQWAYANGCECNELTCQLAATGGHLEVLQWLRSEGIPWTREVLRSSFTIHMHVFDWAYDNGCPGRMDPYLLKNIGAL